MKKLLSFDNLVHVYKHFILPVKFLNTSSPKGVIADHSVFYVFRYEKVRQIMELFNNRRYINTTVIIICYASVYKSTSTWMMKHSGTSTSWYRRAPWTIFIEQYVSVCARERESENKNPPVVDSGKERGMRAFRVADFLTRFPCWDFWKISSSKFEKSEVLVRHRGALGIILLHLTPTLTL